MVITAVPAASSASVTLWTTASPQLRSTRIPSLSATSSASTMTGLTVSASWASQTRATRSPNWSVQAG
jgi:hypothetical protein